MGTEAPRFPAARGPGVGHGYAPTAWGLAAPAGTAHPTELAGRIAGVQSGPPPPMMAGHPATTGDTLMRDDIVIVQVSADRVQVQQALPLYVASGTGAAPVPARSGGGWAQLRPAGRP